MASMEIFSTAAIALYAAHHVGDYWVQTDAQARHKGDAGRNGVIACTSHVLTYTATQALCLALAFAVLGAAPNWPLAWAGLAVSGVTHYLADRREHGIMLKLARALPGKAAFLKLGVPRPGVEIPAYPDEGAPRFVGDNPSLGTGGWALDQAWHIFWGVFVAALIIAA
jgi:hypothetical protein